MTYCFIVCLQPALPLKKRQLTITAQDPFAEAKKMKLAAEEDDDDSESDGSGEMDENQATKNPGYAEEGDSHLVQRKNRSTYPV